MILGTVNSARPLINTNKGNNQVSIAFLCPYPRAGLLVNASATNNTYRTLEQQGISYTIYPFLDERTHRVLYQPGHTTTKIVGLLRGFLRRLVHLVRTRRATYVFIHREATPVGPPWVEWCLARVTRRKIIYDFDDAIWLADRSHVSAAVALAKWPRKVATVCRWSQTVSAGNAYLARFVQPRTAHVVVNPTTIDTDRHHNRLQNQATDQPAIGWTARTLRSNTWSLWFPYYNS